MIKIKKISAEDTYAIRLEVLRENIPLPYEFNGDFDDDTFHLGAFKDGKLIAVSSFMKVKNTNFKGEQYQLRGMATKGKYQGFGAGALMLETAFSILSDFSIDCLWCNAREIAVKFYEKLGFCTFGDVYDLKYIGAHYVMFKELK